MNGLSFLLTVSDPCAGLINTTNLMGPAAGVLCWDCCTGSSRGIGPCRRTGRWTRGVFDISLCPGLVCQGDSLRMGRCMGVDAAEEVPDREG